MFFADVQTDSGEILMIDLMIHYAYYAFAGGFLGWFGIKQLIALANRGCGEGHWLPPKRWLTLLFGFFGRTAPDRWIPHHPKAGRSK